MWHSLLVDLYIEYGIYPNAFFVRLKHDVMYFGDRHLPKSDGCVHANTC